jgi:dTMP kinase
MDSGIFITFEGSEGCGKSTQFERLTRRLSAAQEALPGSRRRVVTVREPGGTPVGEEIRRVLKFSAPGWSLLPETELLLFAASRAQLVRETIAPTLASGGLVLCDRFLDSTTVYQGVARRLSAADVEMVNRFAAGARRPDLTLLFDLPSDAAFARLHRRTRPAHLPPDRMEQEPLDFYEKVRAGYLQLAAREPGRIVVIDAAPPPDRVEQTIWNHLTERFHGLCAPDGL